MWFYVVVVRKVALDFEIMEKVNYAGIICMLLWLITVYFKLCITFISINSHVFGEKYLRDTWSRVAVYRLKMTVLIIGWSWKFTFLMTCSFDDEILPWFRAWSSCVWKGSEMPRERDVTRVLCIEWFNNGLSSIRESIILEGLIADVQWLLDFL